VLGFGKERASPDRDGRRVLSSLSGLAPGIKSYPSVKTLGYFHIPSTRGFRSKADMVIAACQKVKNNA